MGVRRAGQAVSSWACCFPGLLAGAGAVCLDEGWQAGTIRLPPRPHLKSSQGLWEGGQTSSHRFAAKQTEAVFSLFSQCQRGGGGGKKPFVRGWGRRKAEALEWTWAWCLLNLPLFCFCHPSPLPTVDSAFLKSTSPPFSD